MVFVKKLNILLRVFISEIRPEKIVFCYSGQKRIILDQIREV